MNKTLRRIFYICIAGISLFEILNVYFIMPMPGSQEIESLGIAYFLYTARWIFRIIFGIGIFAGSTVVFKTKRKWLPASLLIVALLVIYFFNFRMSADSIFKQARKVVFSSRMGNRLNENSIVIGVEYKGSVKAYPVQFLAYHHQVQDSIGGLPVIVTYCSVCRTGRVYEPIVKGKYEKFRLVGMDHFNAMFEDFTTGSWWRQSNGEAVTGPLKGEALPEVESVQLSLKNLFKLYPEAMVMQADEYFISEYDSLRQFEQGRSKGSLTRTDSLSWEKKSWVVGIEAAGLSKAYDWNLLKKQHLIIDKIGDKTILLILSADELSFAAFEVPAGSRNFKLQNDTIFNNENSYDFTGRPSDTSAVKLKRIKAYQEFWHSWRTFHPKTQKYPVE